MLEVKKIGKVRAGIRMSSGANRVRRDAAAIAGYAGVVFRGTPAMTSIPAQKKSGGFKVGITFRHH